MANEGLPAEGAIELGRVGRREAAAYAFCNGASQFGGPAGSGPTASLVMTEPESGARLTLHNTLDRAEAAKLGRLLLARWQAVADAPAAASFELRDGADLWSGLLLARRHGRGCQREIEVIASRRTVAAPPDDAIAIGAACPARLPARSPWALPSSGAAALLGRAKVPATSVALRLDAARIWAALTTTQAGPARARGLRATMSAAYDLLLGLRDEPDGLGETIAARYRADPVAAVAALACARAPEDERASITTALSQAMALRLDRDSFAAFLERTPDDQAYTGAAQPPASDLRLRPVDGQRLLRRANGPAWRLPRAAAARAA